MRGDDQINQALQMYVLLLRNKQLFTDGIAQTHTHTQSSRVFLFIFIIICMFCVFLYLCKCNLECTIFIIINLLNNVIAMHSRGPHRAHSYHTQHPIQHACKAFAFDFAMKQTVTLRFNRFVKVTNETASMAFGTWSLWVRQTRFYNAYFFILPRLLPTQIGLKGFSRLRRVFMHRAATIECTFPPLIAVHLHGDKSINKLPFPMSHCWLSRKKSYQAATRKLSGSIPQIDANFEQLRLNCIINLLYFILHLARTLPPAYCIINNLRISHTCASELRVANVSCSETLNCIIKHTRHISAYKHIVTNLWRKLIAAWKGFWR